MERSFADYSRTSDVANTPDIAVRDDRQHEELSRPCLPSRIAFAPLIQQATPFSPLPPHGVLFSCFVASRQS